MRSRLLHEPARLAGASLLRLQSDERLAALARDGHEPAFAAIVHRYQGPLLRYCAGIVGPARAEDAVQQAFINAHDALPRMTEVRHLKSWLHRIAHNVSLNTLRAARDEVELDAATAAVSPPPGEAYESAERLRLTLQAVRDLPERQRAALLLRELEGRSHDEIAEALGTTAGGARQHLMRARAAVRQAATAITPYPLIAKVSNAVADPSAARVAEAVAGAGAGATVIKLTAGLAATGALIGGVVGTSAVTHRDPGAPAVARAAEPAKRPASGGQAKAVSLPAPTTAAGTSSGASHRGSGHNPRGKVRHGAAASGEDEHRGSSGDHRSSGESRDSTERHSSTGDGGHRAERKRTESRTGSDDGHDDHSGSETSGSGTSGDDHPETDSPETTSSGDGTSSASGSDGGTSSSGSDGGGTDDSATSTTPTTTTELQSGTSTVETEH